MTNFIQDARIGAALTRLRDSRALPRLADFLIYKRSLSISSGRTLILSSNSSEIVRAVNEYMSIDPSKWGSGSLKTDHLINPFDGTETTNGYRTIKYYSNGFGDTIRGGGFAGIITVTPGKPAAIASLVPTYGAGLSSKMLASKNLPLPRIDDIAFWFYRFSDVSSMVTVAPSPADAAKNIVDQYIRDNAFGPDEISLFAPLNPSDYTDMSWLTPSPADPASYRPAPGIGRATSPARATIPAGPTSGAMPVPAGSSSTQATGTPLQCSFDLVVALAARGFVILSGPSGTGKSRSALQLVAALSAEWQDDPELLGFVPVGAGWTDTRHLLGYRNPFGPPRNDGSNTTHETYQVEDALRLLLKASHSGRSSIPHILLLDEMNLSHVERYFSPFLSLMESSRGDDALDLSLISPSNISLISDVLNSSEPTSIEAQAALEMKAQGKGLRLPPNVFVIGTVNVDQTTYMFSPKVLDRAQVIEIVGVTPDEYLNHSGTAPSNGGRVISGASALAVLQNVDYNPISDLPNTIFVNKAIALGFDQAWCEAVSRAAQRILNEAYKILEPVGFAFGFRLVNEVYRYLEMWSIAEARRCMDAGETLSGQDWQLALDKVFAQKVLPKLHGNRRELGDSLTKLNTMLSQLDASGSFGISNPMSLSRKKINRMNQRLAATGSTTFVE